MGKLLKYVLLALIFLSSVTTLKSQKADKINYKAESLEFGKRGGQKVRILKDDVVFTQKTTTIYCDSAYFYKRKNEMQAFSHVRIVDDSTTITSVRLIYNGDERNAKLRENVIYQRGEDRLYTDFLDYDFTTEIAQYFNNGKLVDSTNTLTSVKADFFAKENYALFQNNVILTTPDFVLKTDTLKYDTNTKIAYTYGPTEIITEDGSKLIAQGGEFETVIDRSAFKQGYVETPDYFLEGDELYFDELNKYYRAKGNVSLIAKNNDIVIIGNEGFYDQNGGLSKIYGLPLMKKSLQNDTLYLAADTLMALESEYDSLKRVLAFYDVKIYKKGLQGVADSMAYFQTDSLIAFYKNPVMWNNKNQISGDTINLEIKNQTIDKMKLRKNSFIISEDTLSNYNQIKGRNMQANFVDNRINLINVLGNGEMLYYGLEKNDTETLGMNKIFCSNMSIVFDSAQRLSSFKVYVNPEAQFIPPHELTPEIQRLANFNWQVESKPTLYEVAYYLDPNLNYDSLLLADSVSVPKQRTDLEENTDPENNIASTRPQSSGNKDNKNTVSKNGKGGKTSKSFNTSSSTNDTSTPLQSTGNGNSRPAIRKPLLQTIDDQ